jgi:hypothetical protein
LVERYGCIAGYPNGTFRGNRAATRYELAAALNACLDQISDKFATKEDLEAVKALQEEFKTELATLKGRVDGLEARTATLEAQQFSTTTKLSGEVVFQAAEFFSTDGRKAVATGLPNAANNARPIFADRVRLNFDTSFTGQDRLRVRLQARNIDSFSTVSGTNQARLSVDGNDSNNFTLDDLYYRFPIGKNAKVTIIANSGEFNDFVGSTFNPYLESSASGAISRFGRFNPIYRFGDSSGSAGGVLNYKITDKIAFSVGYLAPRPTTSSSTIGGLFGGSYSALAQLELQPTKKIGLGITYVHAFQEGFPAVGTTAADNSLLDLTGGTGSAFARRPFGNSPMSSDSIGAEVNVKIAPWINVSGWAAYTKANQENGTGEAEVLNWASAVAFPDLFRTGNMGAIIFGQPPRVIGESNVARNGRDLGATFHIEALYKIKVNGNITVTPGVIVLINPENNSGNATEFVPVIRTTFKF